MTAVCYIVRASAKMVKSNVDKILIFLFQQENIAMLENWIGWI